MGLHHHHHRHPFNSSAVFIPPSGLMAHATPAAAVAPVAAAPSTTSQAPSPTLTSGIRGKVLLEPGNRPLAGATITFSMVNAWIPARSVKSDANGNFSITLPPGDYIVKGLPLQPG